MLSDGMGFTEKRSKENSSRVIREEDSKHLRVIFASDLGILLCWSLEKATIKGIVHSR